MQKNSSAGAIIHGKCPRCRKGDIFKHSAFNPTRFHRMNEECSVCGVRFEREPGFFFGAMYVSYGFSVVIFIAVGLVLALLEQYSLHVYLITTMTVVLILLPALFRYSRILFLHWFGGVDFDPGY